MIALGVSDSENDHELDNRFTVNTRNGGLTLTEWKCNKLYVIAGCDPDYCPNCGKRLPDR